MCRNILEYLESSAARFGDKTAFDDDKSVISFRELEQRAQAVGSVLAPKGLVRRPAVVFLPKGCGCITAFMGIVYAGGFYCPIDTSMPAERISMIFRTLEPAVVITTERYAPKISGIASGVEIVMLEQAQQSEINHSELSSIRRNMIDTDPLYVLFTSGSTGVPKGVLISHRGVIDYIEWVASKFNIDDGHIFANQAPFYFDNSILDIYCTLKCGATTVILPQRKMMFPKDLIEYLDEKKVNIIFWVPSLLCNVADMRALDVVAPKYLTKILFCGEVMPNKQLNVWRRALPDVLYANLYGPTEITDVCTYYIVDREFTDDEPLPIGVPCENTRALVLDDNGREVAPGESGELCIAGTCLALGYYNDYERTSKVFTQNPLNSSYEEKVYHTGDIVKYNDCGELMYLSRKDFQIKHMGHRIELGEIETAMGGISQISGCACVYDDARKEICVFFTGGEELVRADITAALKARLQTYMIPSRYLRMSKLPHNINGKVDRRALTSLLSSADGAYDEI